MQQIIIDFGVLRLGDWEMPIRIYGYGLMLVLGFLVAIALASWRARRAGENPDAVTYCGILALIGGIAGSRLAYVAQHWQTQFADEPNPLAAILNISSGGLIYYGGVLGAMILVIGYLAIKRLPIRRYLDILGVSLMIGLAFGRTGCLLNGCCFGGPAREDWALATHFPMYSKPLVKIDGRENPYSQSTEMPTPPYLHQFQIGRVDPPDELIETVGDERFLIPPGEFDERQVALAETCHSHAVQPAQALGILNALLIAGLLAAFYRLRTREGQVFLLMLVLYAPARFVLESIRDDNPHNLAAGVLTHNQYTSLATFAVAVVLMLLLLRRLPASAGPTWAQRLAADQATPPTPQSNKRSKKKR